MRPTDTSNIQEVCTYLLCLPAFADLLEASDVQNIEKLVGPDDKVTAHESVRLVYASRGSIAEQSRQAKIIVPALVDDIRTRAATFLPGGKVASMTEEQKERISTAELNQDRVESTFGMKGEMQRSAPNEKHHTSEARSVARVNKPITSEPMQKLTPPQRTQSWTAARQLSRVIEQERPQERGKTVATESGERERDNGRRRTKRAQRDRGTSQIRTNKADRDSARFGQPSGRHGRCRRSRRYYARPNWRLERAQNRSEDGCDRQRKRSSEALDQISVGSRTQSRSC